MLYRNRLISEERLRPNKQDTTFEDQLFLSGDSTFRQRRAVIAREIGSWQEEFSPEQTAYALAQVTASNILPPLLRMDSGSDLLHYQVRLRDYLDDMLVTELVTVLDSCAMDTQWEQVEASEYACVIGAGVAACINTAPGEEQLYLRYANALAAELGRVQRAAELPRSLLFLQTALQEKLDVLLQEVRRRTWFWLVG